MKKKVNKLTVGIILVVMGVISFFGSFTKEEDFMSLFFGSLLFIAAGILLIVLDHNKKKKIEKHTPTYYVPAESDNTQSSSQFMEDLQKKIKFAEELRERTKISSEKFDSMLNSIPHVPVEVSKDITPKNQLMNKPDYVISNITRATVIDKIFPLVIIDTETTGLGAVGNDIIEVSAIKYEKDFTPVSCFSTLLKPNDTIPASATDVNHITDEMVKDCPQFGNIEKCFSEYIKGCNIVGHNVAFDLKFLYTSGCEVSNKARIFDTLMLAKLVIPKSNDKYGYDCEHVPNYKLDTLCEYYGISRNDAHRSLSDCLATAIIFEKLINDKTY